MAFPTLLYNNRYFQHFTGHNPFGFSSTNLGSLYKGLVGDTSKNFKHLRKTRHTHHPVDDTRGNAEALLAMLFLTTLPVEPPTFFVPSMIQGFIF